MEKAFNHVGIPIIELPRLLFLFFRSRTVPEDL